jgi:hypothetical protein
MRLLARSGQRRAAFMQYQACRRALREELSAPASSETIALFNRIRAATAPPPHSVPAPATRLVGRTGQLRALGRLLAEPKCRLVSICGPAGSGKTRVALEVARGFAASICPPPEQPFPDGIFVVNMAERVQRDEALPICGSSLFSNAAHHILSRIDAALGVPGRAATDLGSRVKNFLAPKAMLLVLDDLDHLRTGAHVLGELLACAPHLKLLVTTRVPLLDAGEHVLQLDGLRVPRCAEDIETAEASMLFLQEARRVSVGFALPEGQREPLVRVCQLVGGFPLALILAARWTRALPCSALADELATGLGLEILQTTDPDLPERHRGIADASILHAYSRQRDQGAYAVAYAA